MKTLYLLGCSKAKTEEGGPAYQVYRGALFRRSRAWAMSQMKAGELCLILSAKLGLLYPEEIIEPYDLELKDLAPWQRAGWANQIWHGRLFEILNQGQFTRVVFLCGANYQHYIKACVKNSSIAQQLTLEDPLNGLEIGQRLRWLKQNTPKERQVQ